MELQINILCLAGLTFLYICVCCCCYGKTFLCAKQYPDWYHFTHSQRQAWWPVKFRHASWDYSYSSHFQAIWISFVGSWLTVEMRVLFIFTWTDRLNLCKRTAEVILLLLITEPIFRNLSLFPVPSFTRSFRQLQLTYNTSLCIAMQQGSVCCLDGESSTCCPSGTTCNGTGGCTHTTIYRTRPQETTCQKCG